MAVFNTHPLPFCARGPWWVDCDKVKDRTSKIFQCRSNNINPLRPSVLLNRISNYFGIKKGSLKKIL